MTIQAIAAKLGRSDTTVGLYARSVKLAPKKKGHPRLSEGRREQAKLFRNAGLKYADIARELGVSKVRAREYVTQEDTGWKYVRPA
jgi:transposase